MTTEFALAQLRHLYSLMLAGHVNDTVEAARGLLGPSIAALEKASLSSVPEDVARDHDAVESDLRTEGYTDTSNAMQALSRLATAAARVPGLDAWQRDMLHALSLGVDYTPTADKAVGILKGIVSEVKETEQQLVTAESERAAARQEATTANEQLQAVHRQMAEVAQVLDAEVVPDGWGAHAAAQKRMAEHRALTARVAELESSLTYVKASSAKAEADLARYKMTADSLNAMWETAEARALAEEKREAPSARELHEMRKAYGAVQSVATSGTMTRLGFDGGAAVLVLPLSAYEAAVRKAAEDMRERAAETADGGPLRVRGVLMTPRERILALPLESK